MQEIRDLLKQREKQIEQLQKEIEALRMTLMLLEDKDGSARERKVESTAAAPTNGNGKYVAVAAPKQFP